MFALPKPRALCHHRLLETKAAGLKSRIVRLDLTGQIQNASSDFILQEQILPRKMHADSLDMWWCLKEAAVLLIRLSTTCVRVCVCVQERGRKGESLRDVGGRREKKIKDVKRSW